MFKGGGGGLSCGFPGWLFCVVCASGAVCYCYNDRPENVLPSTTTTTAPQAGGVGPNPWVS